MRRTNKTIALLAAALLVAAALAVSGIGLAQTPPQLRSVYTTEQLPLTDPSAAIWQQAAPIEVALTAQSAVTPALLEKSINSVRVRSLNDGQWISFLIEWQDSTRDVHALKPDEFRDAAAMQFPLNPEARGACMGARGLQVNLWHWKADWQEDIDKGFQEVTDAYPNFWLDLYPYAVGEPPYSMPESWNSVDARRYMAGWAAGNPFSDPYRVTPVQELAAEGFGTATHRLRQAVLGRGEWNNGTWRVVMSRPLTSDDESAVQFAPGGTHYVAFAVWNGSNDERGPRKQLSADTAMIVEAPGSGVSPWASAGVAVIALALGGGIGFAIRRGMVKG